MPLVDRIKRVILEVIRDKSKINSFSVNKYQVYAFTNENIAAYLENIDLNPHKKVLTVCSGGDHLLNLGSKKVKNVDLIDINPMTEFFTFGIKIPLILTYSFIEFKKVIEFLFKSKNYDLNEEKKILYGLLPLMDLKYRMFFKEIFDYYFILQEQYHVPIKLMQIITTDYYFNLDEITFYNLYLQDEEIYNNLRKMFAKMNLSFKRENIFNINRTNQYDLIICSNALEYTYIPKCDILRLKEFFRNLKDALRDNGLIMATYIYGFYNGEYPNYPINGTDVSIRELLKEEIIMVDSYKNWKDAVLVLRK